MKFLKDTFDNLRPNFEKGGKLHFLHSTFDAFETFTFVPDKTTQHGAHIRDGIDLKRTMFTVVIALIPALLFGMWNVGYQQNLAMGITDAGLLDNFWIGFQQVLPIIVVSYVVGLGIEFTFCQIKGHPVNEGFLVTGMLIPLCLPPDIPLWMVAVATAFAVIVGKEVFGGTGMNILNPALTARVFLYIAYPSEMSGDLVWINGMKEGTGIVDGYSGATSLGLLGTGQNIAASAYDSFMGLIPGSIGETSTLMVLIGAVILIASGIGSWKIMAGVFAGGYVTAALIQLIPGDVPFYNLDAFQHLIIGGFAFGAVFMATDPVSAAQTERGKWIYGILIGVLTILIRVFNPAYPEGIMFAILFMNVMAPLVDYYVIKSNIKRRLSRVTA
jgi:Na+-transporting NADH:ubiquinone oxidoreductase subunit B